MMFYSPAVFVVDEKMSSRKKRSHLAWPRAVIRFSVPNRMDGWMDGLRFYVFFNNISVISGHQEGKIERRDDRRVCNNTPFSVGKISASSGSRTRYLQSSRSAINQLSYRGSYS